MQPPPVLVASALELSVEVGADASAAGCFLVPVSGEERDRIWWRLGKRVIGGKCHAGSIARSAGVIVGDVFIPVSVREHQRVDAAGGVEKGGDAARPVADAISKRSR